MLDPRNMPYARVCLSRLSPTELPPNALQQYHNYVAKRKSSDPTLIEDKEQNGTGISVQHPAVSHSFVSGVSDLVKAGANTPNVAKGVSVTKTSAQSAPINYFHLPEDNQHLNNGVDSLNVAKETIGSQYPFVNYCCTTQVLDHQYTDTSSCNIVREANVTATPVQLLPTSCVMNDKVDVKAVDVQPCRRNSATSLSSSHSSSNGRELIAHVRLSPVLWDSPRNTNRQYVNHKPQGEQESSDEAMSDVTDEYTLSGTKRTCNLDVAYEPSVKSSSSTADASEPSALSDDSTYLTGFTSFKDHVMYGCADVWPDFNSYSPPESPDPQNTETVSSKQFEILPTEKVLSMEADTSVPLETGIFLKMQIEEPGGIPKNEKSERRHLSTRQIGLLSPEIKLVPLDINVNRRYEEQSSYSNVSPSKRKSLSPKGDLVVKLSDVGDCLKPRANGGLTVANSVRTGRYTTYGRQILANYSEKSLAKSVMKGAVATEVKKRKTRNKVPKCLHHQGQQCTCIVGNQPGKKGRKRKRKNAAETKRNAALLRYDNLKFKELNTIPRITTRYKVAFTKWPYVFSSALDLINQRLSNQNAFWNSIRS